MNFVETAANLKADVYGIPRNKNRNEIAAIIETVNVPVFAPRSGTGTVILIYCISVLDHFTDFHSSKWWFRIWPIPKRIQADKII